MTKRETEQCTYMLEGPLVWGVGKQHPAWRRTCKRRTSDKSGRCWQHRRRS